MKKISCIQIINMLIITLVILPFLIACFYAVPAADDFTFQFWVRDNAVNGSYFIPAFQRTVFMYKTWMGTYFGLFFDLFLSPFARWGLIGMEIELLIIVGGFFLSVGYFLSKVLEQIKKKHINAYWTVMALSFLYIMLFLNVTEAFYWHQAACLYTVPLSLGLLSAGMYLDVIRQFRRSKFIVSCFMAFCAVGGNLQISALVCVILFGIAMIRILHIKKVENTSFIFLSALVGALVNVAAPGNYARHQVVDEEYHLFGAMVWSLESVVKKIMSDCSNMIFLIAVVGILLIGIKSFKESELGFKHPWLLTAWLFMGMVMVDFPVKLGYGYNEFPPRCQFVEGFMISLSMIILAVYWGGYISKKRLFNFSHENIACISLVMVVILLMACKDGIIEESMLFRVYHAEVSGELAEFRKENAEALEYIAKADEEEVFLDNMLPDGKGILPDMGLSADTEDWINKGIARYYGKKLVGYK